MFKSISSNASFGKFLIKNEINPSKPILTKKGNYRLNRFLDK